MLTLTAHIDEHGKLKSPRIAEINAFCNRYRGKTIELTLKIKRKRRSNEQSRYYWGVVVEMVREGLVNLGHEIDAEETHEFLKARFNYANVPSKDGELIQIPQSTAKLTTVEFMAYIARIQQFASEYLGVVIPDPETQTAFDFTLVSEQTSNNTSFLIAEKKRV